MPDPKPTFEERMEAVAETLDLVSRMQLQTEKELAALTRFARSLRDLVNAANRTNRRMAD